MDLVANQYMSNAVRLSILDLVADIRVGCHGSESDPDFFRVWKVHSYLVFGSDSDWIVSLRGSIATSFSSVFGPITSRAFGRRFVKRACQE